MRRQRSTLVATKRGAAIVGDPAGLWDVSVGTLLAPVGYAPTFVQDARELILQMLLIEGAEGKPTDVNKLAQVSGGILARSWDLEAIQREPGGEIEWVGYFSDLRDALAPLRAFDLVDDDRKSLLKDPWLITLTDIGRAAAAAALKARMVPKG